MKGTLLGPKMLIRIILIAIAFMMSGCSGKTKEDMYAEGLKQLSKANPNGAVVLFRSALEKDQNYFDARIQLARVLMTTGKYDQAEKEFQKVIHQNPSRTEIKLDLARLYSFTNRPDLAIKEAEEHLKLKPGNADALEVLGVAYANKNKLDDGERYLLQALHVDAKRVSAKLELAVLYKTQGREADVRRMLDEVIKADTKDSRAYYMLASLEYSLGNRGKALEIYRSIADMNKSDSVALYKCGAMYLEQGDTEKALKVAGELLQKFPRRGEGNRLKGLVNYNKKNYSESIADLQNSIKVQPTIEAYYFLGLSLFNVGELENALSQFRKILDENPSFQRARILTGMILLKQKRLDDAIAEIKKVLETDPKQALAHNILGSAYMAKGLFDDGMRELSKAIALDPKIVDAYLKKGVFNLSKGNSREAELDFQAAVQVAPEMLDTRLILASYYLRQNNHTKAMSLLNQGINGKKSDAPLYNFMAAIMFNQNNQADGLKYLLKSKAADPDAFTAYYNIATFYAASGEYDKSLNEYREVLKKDPLNLKALLGYAALVEVKGNEKEAYDYYQTALQTKSAVAYLALANYYMKKNQKSNALSVLDDALKVSPRDLNVLEMKGRILIEDKDYSGAVRVFNDIEGINPDESIRLKIGTYIISKDYSKAKDLARRIITLKSNSAYGYIMLATVFDSQNDLPHAIEELKNGLRVDRENLQAILMLGNLYAKHKEYSAAMDCYAAALKKNPDFAQALFAQGALLDTTGKKKEAIKKYQATLAKSENFMPALNNLAYLYLDGYGSPKEGLRLAFSGYRQDPSNAGVMDTLGYALLKNGRKVDAQKLLEGAAAKMPDNPTISYHLALAYKENGSKDKAIKSLQKSLASGDSPDAGIARKMLDELKR